MTEQETRIKTIELALASLQLLDTDNRSRRFSTAMCENPADIVIDVADKIYCYITGKNTAFAPSNE